MSLADTMNIEAPLHQNATKYNKDQSNTNSLTLLATTLMMVCGKPTTKIKIFED